MLFVAIPFAALLSGIGFWLVRRQLSRQPRSVDHWDQAPTPIRDAARVIEKVGAPGVDAIDLGKVAAANALFTQRLWRLAFAAGPQSDEWQAADMVISGQVRAALSAELLDGRYFPRRPTLMPQLMRAMEDPRAATERLSRIVAHDPVLAADVLKLANSSRFRTASQPIETLQRAIVVMGVDALRGLLAVAMMQPVFRASRSNFPRFPRMLWDRTERAARAAEAFVVEAHPQDRFEAQLAILLSALGPLVVYGATLDVYAQSPGLVPNPALCAALTGDLGANTAMRIAHHWEASPRLVAAIEHSSREPLAQALCVGELLGTLSLLESQHVIEAEEALEAVNGADLSSELLEYLTPRAA